MKLVCPYCNTDIEAGDDNGTSCPACGAAHHQDCWQENGGCTIFGCVAAPADEPAVTVRSSDIAAVPPPAPAHFGPVAAPPPGLSLPPPPPPDQSPLPTLSFAGYNPPAPTRPALTGVRVASAKSRTTYVLLGVFLGVFGAHNFYAGYTGRAVAQLCITLFTFFLGGAVVSWVWAIVEVCIVNRDSRNISME
jgi:TM2 domain-containing membrane protein YozV